MSRLGKVLAIVCVVGAVPALALAAAGSSTLPGTWHKLPAAPFPAPRTSVSVWTGNQLIVFGSEFTAGNKWVDRAESYVPGRNAWTRLSPPSSSRYSPGYQAVWTGKEVLAFGAFHSMAYNPARKTWRTLRYAVPGGITVWTGREAIGWGGGCCGDAFASGAAYNPTTDSYRRLSRSPLAPSQRPVGAWNGHELLLFVSGDDPEGKPWPARFARGAAYNPATNSWRRLAPLPNTGPRFASSAVWDGHEVLVPAVGAGARLTYAYSPATDKWRLLAPLPSGRVGSTAVWTGTRLVLWGGSGAGGLVTLRDGVAYNPHTNSWASVPAAPLRARSNPAVAWTGQELIVWGGVIGTPGGTRLAPRFPRDGAAFTPITR
jgi:N-acetylneuraminic acid mutarotase